MVKFNRQRSAPAMDRTFAALADPTRRSILARLAEPGDADAGVRVTELAAPFADAMSLPAVSKHLKVLERAGLIRREKDGRVRRCHLEAEPLRDAAQWIAYFRRFWADRLDALAEYLEDHEAKKGP
ncbi:MAG: metalloregulator ArsR/SmtB family transcription factor [Planctomycetota bacterium]